MRTAGDRRQGDARRGGLAREHAITRQGWLAYLMIDHLTRAGYVEATKAFVGRRPRTTVRVTPEGRAAFARHVAFLKEIIAG